MNIAITLGASLALAAATLALAASHNRPFDTITSRERTNSKR
jgi:hypothetical protein